MRKKIFYTADWHCYHANVINFCDRPFKDVHHMHRVLINNYNSIVPTYGICYFGGDMGLKTNVKDIISELNGTKVLIVGNHDKKTNAMYVAGFDVVLYGAIFNIAGEMVTFTHCPLRGLWREDTSHIKKSANENWHNENKLKKFSIEDFGQFLHMHGHIHSDGKKSHRIFGHQLDVGVDANNFFPVSQSQVESIISRLKGVDGRVGEGSGL